jgi:uncharacterized protein YcfJ
VKNLVLTTALLLTATPVLAEYAITATVTDHFRTVTRNVPQTEQVCSTVEVPVYGGQGSNTGDTIVGAIIGGAIGNQFGNGNGKDAMTVLGAIVGADVANRSAQGNSVVGYRREQQCQNITTYSTTYEEVYSHSTIMWREGGRNITLDFQR